MNGSRRRSNNIFIGAFVLGLVVLLVVIFNGQGLHSVGSSSSPVSTAIGVQPSPLATLAANGVPLAQIGGPLQLQASGPLGLVHLSPDKIVNIAGEKGTVLLDPTNGLTRTLATTGLINARASGHWLVYEDRPLDISPASYYSRIKVVDLDTGKEILLGDQNANQQDPQVSGNFVVWVDWRNGEKSGADVYGYDLTTGLEFPVVTGPRPNSGPKISSHWMVYVEPSSETSLAELRAHSLNSGDDFSIGLVPVTQDSWFRTRYAIDGDKVVWTKQTSSVQYTYELHLYDLTKRTDRQLTQPQPWPLASLSLSTQSGLVAFNNDGRRMVLDWLQPEPIVISVTPPVQAQWGYELSVAGDYLVWQIPRNSDYSDGKVFISRVSR